MTVKIENHVTPSPQYHMILHECSRPGFVDGSREDAVWDCEIFQDALHTDTHGYTRAPVCADDSKDHSLYVSYDSYVTYQYPSDAAFHVSANSFLVFKVHLVDTQANWTDQGFGMDLTVTTDPVPRLQDTLISWTKDGIAVANSTTYMEHVCPVTLDRVLQPFTWLVHGHKLTQCVSMWKVDGVSGAWTLIGRNAGPVYGAPVPEGMTLKKGDMIAVRCTQVNPGSRDVGVG